MTDWLSASVEAQPGDVDAAVTRRLEGCIVLPLRGSPLDEAKLHVARQQALALDAPVLLLHVLPPGAHEAGAVSPAEATGRALLDGIAADLRASGMRAWTLVRRGAPAPTIVEEARTRRAKLIILGSTARSRLLRTLLGSVADEVIRDAPCRVLLVQPPSQPSHRRPLLTLNPPDLLVPRDLGRRTVDVARIVGSATRAHELGPDFRPLHPAPQDEQRFQSVLGAMVRGEEVPPVDLYKLGFGYYVRDGHHRVAAARQLGSKEMAATVTELVPLDDLDAERAFAARRSFERTTGLTRIGATRAESYDRLWTLIEAYRQERGLPDAQGAAGLWFGEVFRPLWRRVRELGLAQRFPDERAADVIARVAAWRAAEAARTGAPPSWEEALDHFASSTATMASSPTASA